MTITVTDFAWKSLADKFKDFIMFKTPMYVTLIAVIVVSFGCTSLFCPALPMGNFVQLFADTDRIAKKVLEEDTALINFESLILKHEISKEAQAKLIKDLNAYKDIKLKNAIFTLKYFDIALDEYKEIWRLTHGELSSDMKLSYFASKKQIKDALAKLTS